MTPEAAAYNLEFLKTKAFYDMKPRNVTDVIPTEDQVHDGDFFGILVCHMMQLSHCFADGLLTAVGRD